MQLYRLTFNSFDRGCRQQAVTIDWCACASV